MKPRGWLGWGYEAYVFSFVLAVKQALCLSCGIERRAAREDGVADQAAVGNGGFADASWRRDNGSQVTVLGFATKSPALNSSTNSCRKTHPQKVGDLRQISATLFALALDSALRWASSVPMDGFVTNGGISVWPPACRFADQDRLAREGQPAGPRKGAAQAQPGRGHRAWHGRTTADGHAEGICSGCLES
ncbi:hypothetical protein BQ8794_140443 [Mesorhizobium prunaredense]|uniref:Uncharacterized protein n=1 Tax=Mesorhizobium prunaredense TaxID=1631249 RepID=A0A1R3V4Z2_9HYPH|nr:hypothetical protein BQ8794_140443 [Mesorhizobium prunaredense]